MRGNVFFLLLAFSLCVPAAAQDDKQKSERLGLARHITEPTAYFASVRSRDLIDAVKASNFWKRALLQRGLAMIPPDVAAAIEQVMAQTSDEFGVWVPRTSVEPFARLLGLVPDAGSAALGWMAGDFGVFEWNKGRQKRVVEALEKGIIPTLILFNRTDQAGPLAAQALAAVKQGLPPMLQLELKKESNTHLGTVRLQAKKLLPQPAQQLVQSLPLTSKLNKKDQERVAKAIESMELVIAFGRIGDYLVASFGPDAKALASLEKNLAQPPPVEKTLAGSPMLAGVIEDMTARTLSIETGDGRDLRLAMRREFGKSLNDLQKDFAFYKVGAPSPGLAAQFLPQIEQILAALRAELDSSDGTNGLWQAVTLVDRGLLSVQRTGLVEPARSVRGGEVMAGWLPKETLLSGISVVDAHEQGASVDEIIDGLGAVQAWLKDYAGMLGPDAEDQKRMDQAFASVGAILRQFRARVVPALGQWSAFVITASGHLEVPDELEYKLPIPELALIVQVRDAAAIEAFWKFARDETLDLINKLVPDEPIANPEASTWRHRDVTIHGYDLPALVGGFKGDIVPNACFVSGHMILSTSLRLTKRIVDLAKGEAKGESIRERPHYKAMAGKLYARAAYDHQIFVDLGGWVDYAKKITDILMKAGADDGKIPEDDQALAGEIFDLLKVMGAIGQTTGSSATTQTTRTWILLTDE